MTHPSMQPPTADDRQLTALFDRMCAAWTTGDATAYAACFTEDCDYISFDGNRARGRAAVLDSHHKLFTGVLYRSALVGHVETIHHLTDNVAIIHATGSVQVAWRKKLPRRRLTRNTITAIRTPDGWSAAAIHNGRIRPLTIPDPDSMPAKIAHSLVRITTALHDRRGATTPTRRKTTTSPH
jgi:uncharacterized protein (TIGR02246 family)